MLSMIHNVVRNASYLNRASSPLGVSKIRGDGESSLQLRMKDLKTFKTSNFIKPLNRKTYLNNEI